MNFLELNNLHNPEKIVSIMHKDGTFYDISKNQGFQETNGRIEIWEKLDDGRLMLVVRWNKTSILATYH